MGVDGGGDILVSRVENVSCGWTSEKKNIIVVFYYFY